MKEEYYYDESIDRDDLRDGANPIPKDQYKRFIYSLEEVSRDYPERNKVLINLQIGTGYRMQDLTPLTIGDIREALYYGSFLIQEQKQMKSWMTRMKNNPKSNSPKPAKRQVEIEPRSNLEKMLKSYVQGKKNSEYAFPSNGKFGYITAKSFSRILSKAGENIGLENISGHSGRKSYATWMYERTGNIAFVAKQIGHKNPETTLLYIGANKSDRKKAANIMSNMISFFQRLYAPNKQHVRKVRLNEKIPSIYMLKKRPIKNRGNYYRYGTYVKVRYFL